MKKITLLLVLLLGLTLAACGSAKMPTPSNPPTATAQPQPTQTAETAQPQATPAVQQPATQELARTDSQGAVTVLVEPLNLTGPGETLTFEISLDTHSVDLSMDLATLATLSTDTGRTVQATSWDAPRGGHHVSGTLFFPASIDEKPLLDGATKLTLTIENVDAPERVFTWDLPQ